MVSITDGEMTSATHLYFLPTVWATDCRKAIQHAEVLAKLVNTQYESQLSIGRTIRIPIRGSANTQSKTEGISDTIEFQTQTAAATADYQDITVSTYEYAAKLINVVVEAQSKYAERKQIADEIGYALMRGVETAIAALPQNFSQIVGTLGSDPDDSTLRRAWQYLADNSVFDNASWCFGPAAVAAMFGNDKFTSRDFVDGKSAIETAKLPSLYSYPIYLSNLLRNPATGQTECFLAHKEAMILIRQIKPTMKTDYLIRNNADGIIGFDLFTVAEAAWSSEALSTGDANPTKGDYGAVLIRSA